MKLFNKLYVNLLRLKNSPEYRKSIIYLLASSTGYGIVFIQNFSIAYLISLSFFGKITLLISLFSTLYVIFTLGMNSVILRFYFDKEYSSDSRKLISHVATIWMTVGFIIMLILSLVGLFIVGKYLPIDYKTEFIPILVGSFLYSFIEIFPTIFIVKEKPLLYSWWLILTRATIFLFLLIAIFAFEESASHVSFMLLISGACLFAYGVIAFKIFPIKIPLKKDLNQILKYAFPLMIYALGGIGYSHGYRVIISNWLDYNNLAIFSMANQIVMIYYLIAASSITGFYPRAYKALENNHGNPKAIAFYLRLLLIIGIGLAILILPLAYTFLYYFKDGSFMNAFEAIPILMAGQFVYFLYSYSYVLCTFYKETKILTYAMLAGVATSLVMAAILLGEGKLWQASLPIACGIFVQFALSLTLLRFVNRKRISNPDVPSPENLPSVN